MRAFPPRLPGQPIFYPVLTLEYARKIARDWNTKDERSGFAGYVLKFDIEAAYLERYEVQCAGAQQHLEYWIPASELAEFNQHIVGKLEVVESYTPSKSRGDS